MFQNKKVALTNPMYQIYNMMYFARWAIYLFGIVTYRGRVRTISGLMVMANLVSTIWSLFSLPSMRKPAGYLILVSEIFLFIRHSIQAMFWIDQFSKTSKLGQKWVNSYSVIMFFSYILGTLVEFVLLFEPLYSKASEEVRDSNNGPSPSQQLDIVQLDNGGELEERIHTYKTRRSSN